ncbi:MAG: FhaA domain-containing protein [Solirubrobacterales bacterium]
MSVLRSIEEKIENLVEGVFSRAFRSEVQPVEIARKLAKEMDANKTASVSRTYVPNEFTVWLAAEDHERFTAYEGALAQELSAYLLEHARRSSYDLLTRPRVKLDRDERLGTGEFGIQARLVKSERDSEPAAQGEAGETRIYSALPKDTGRKAPARKPATTAVLQFPGKRFVVDESEAVVGRSSGCDCVVDDPNVSRRHAFVRRSGDGRWEVGDLDSTNGIKINGRRVDRGPLASGDEVSLGTSSFTFTLE